MLQRPWYRSSLFLLLLLLPLLLLLSGYVVANAHFENCSEYLLCGNINVSYPFRLLQSSNNCGYPGYELNCSNLHELTIKLDGKDYVVQQINYDQRFLEVVDSEFMRTDCPLSFTNTSINSTLYNYASGDSNFTIYLNCSSQRVLPGLSEITCLSKLWNKKSYYYYGPSNFQELAVDCELTTVVPVHYNTTPFEKALKEGFGLTWNYRAEWCQGCLDSGGICGYNETSPRDQICFCSDTNSLGSCFYTHKNRNKGLIIGCIMFFLFSLATVGHDTGEWRL